MNNLIYALNQRITATGSLGVGTISNEASVRFNVDNADVTNSIIVEGRINGDPNWTTITTLTGSTNELVDVFTWDELQVTVDVYDSLSDHIFITASSFDSIVSETQWGSISGTLADQVDLQAELDSLQDNIDLKLDIATYEAGFINGSATLVAGTVDVLTASVTADSLIFLTPQNSSGTAGHVRVTARTAGVSFTITSSSALDTSLIAWKIEEPS